MKKLLAELKNSLGEIHCIVDYDPGKGLIYAEWIGYHTVEDVQRGCLTVLELLEDNKGKYPGLVSNISKVEGAWEDANGWIATEFMPRAIAAGLKKIGHLVGSDVFSQMSEESLRVNLEGLFTIGSFDKEEDVVKWLTEEPVLA